jgi:hypothetical protein
VRSKKVQEGPRSKKVQEGSGVHERLSRLGGIQRQQQQQQQQRPFRLKKSSRWRRKALVGTLFAPTPLSGVPSSKLLVPPPLTLPAASPGPSMGEDPFHYAGVLNLALLCSRGTRQEEGGGEFAVQVRCASSLCKFAAQVRCTSSLHKFAAQVRCASSLCKSVALPPHRAPRLHLCVERAAERTLGVQKKARDTPYPPCSTHYSGRGCGVPGHGPGCDGRGAMTCLGMLMAPTVNTPPVDHRLFTRRVRPSRPRELPCTRPPSRP